MYFINQGGIEELSISGGEPFLHPDLFEMVKFCKSKGIRTVVFTSGIKKASAMPTEMIEYIKNKCKQDLQEIEEYHIYVQLVQKNWILNMMEQYYHVQLLKKLVQGQ